MPIEDFVKKGSAHIEKCLEVSKKSGNEAAFYSCGDNLSDIAEGNENAVAFRVECPVEKSLYDFHTHPNGNPPELSGQDMHNLLSRRIKGSCVGNLKGEVKCYEKSPETMSLLAGALEDMAKNMRDGKVDGFTNELSKLNVPEVVNSLRVVKLV